MDARLKRFGLNLKSLRESAQISQEELAERAGLHRTYISGVERGTRNISLKNILNIVMALNLEVSSLFEGTYPNG